MSELQTGTFSPDLFSRQDHRKDGAASLLLGRQIDTGST